MAAEAELRERRLRCPARTDDRQQLARLHRERDLVDHVGVRLWVAESDVVELHRATRAADRASAHRLDDTRLLVEQLDDPLRRSHRARDAVVETAESAYRAIELGEQGEECQQAAEREPAACELPRPDSDDEERTRELDELDERAVPRLQSCRRKLRDEASLPFPPEALDLGRLAVVRLDQLDVREALLHDGAHRAAPAADLSGGGAAEAREPPAGNQEDRSNGEREDREIPL